MEVLLRRMEELQQQVEEECSQEELITRFERERSESIPTGMAGLSVTQTRTYDGRRTRPHTRTPKANKTDI